MISNKYQGQSVLTLFLLVLLSITASCVSNAPEASSGEPIIIEAADLTIRLVPVSRDELRERHGANTDRMRNPFIDQRSQLTRKRIVVFEADISTTESTVLFALEDNSLMIGGQTSRGTSRELLLNFWKGHASQEELATMHDKTLRYMLNREFTVEPGKPAQGYLVYAHNFPKEGGEGLLRFTVRTPDGSEGTLEETVNFTERGLATEEEKVNTGIFAQD